MSKPFDEERELRALLETLASRDLTCAAPVERAFRLACRGHERQQRKDGSPYVVHPLRVCRILLEDWSVDDPDVLAAALLHDVVEDTDVTLDHVGESFGARTAEIVDHLSKPPLDKGMGEEAYAEAKAAREVAYFERMAQGPPEAALVKMADRFDNLTDLLSMPWPEARKRAYVTQAIETIAPLGIARYAQAATRLIGLAEEVGMALDEGRGDMPDVGPHEDLVGVTGGDDPVVVCSKHLSYFARQTEVYLYHDLVGDIIEMHPKVIPFLDFFRKPHLASEGREAFKDEFLEGDFDAFFETFAQHLVLMREDEDDGEIVQDWYPIRGPWILSYREGKGLALCYKDRRQGDVLIERLPELEARVYTACDGQRTVAQIRQDLTAAFPNVDDVSAKVWAAIQRWAHSDRQLLKLLPRSLEALELVGLPPYAQSTMPYQRMSRPDPDAVWFEEPAESAQAEVVRDYHKLEIRSASEQFEVRETTISHALRVPHPALGGRPYGGALGRVLLQRDVLTDTPQARDPYRVVEVGGGTGYVARALLDALALASPRLYNRMRYTIVDLAPVLRASQAQTTRVHGGKVRVVGGDACALPLGDASQDCILSNEMIADLRVVPTRREDIPVEGSGGPGADMVRKYRLIVDDAPGLFFVNVGAIELLEECARVLKPGGTAFVTEFGSHSRYPDPSTHLDHPEFSIHFGHMKTVAEALGLEVSLEILPTLLELEGTVPVLQTTQSFFLTLRAFAAHHGVELNKIAYTEDMLRELLGDKLDLDRLQGLKFEPCGTRLLGLKPKEFKVLLLRKPITEGRKVKKVALDF